ncbi:hypothetical protein [Gordonia sputi]
MNSVRVTVPVELANALGDSPGVEETGARRSSWEIALHVLTGATTTISLLQAPQTLADVSARIRSFLGSDTIVGEGKPIVIEVTGPRGQVRAHLSSESQVGEIRKVLTETLFDVDEDAAP